MIHCDHPRHERCLYWQYKWWDLCLSCGYAWCRINKEEFFSSYPSKPMYGIGSQTRIIHVKNQ